MVEPAAFEGAMLVTRPTVFRWDQYPCCSPAAAALNLIATPTASTLPSPSPGVVHKLAAVQFGKRAADWAAVMSPGSAAYISLNEVVAASKALICATVAAIWALVISCCPFRTPA